jgi:hypothetical protein
MGGTQGSKLLLGVSRVCNTAFERIQKRKPLEDHDPFNVVLGPNICDFFEATS